MRPFHRKKRNRTSTRCSHPHWRLVPRSEMSFSSGTHGRHFDSFCTKCRVMA